MQPRGLIPDHAAHVAIATVHGMDYLLTWNCRHIVNAEIMRRLAKIAEGAGYSLPVLCTPNKEWETKRMLNDPIVEEILRIRDEHAARFNYDLDAIFDDFEKSQRELGLPLVTLPANRVSKPAGAPDQSGGCAA